MLESMAKQVRDYAGAVGNIAITDVLKLSPSRFRVQPKIDGAYCAVRLDHAGRVAQITSRTGADYGRLANSFRGIRLGPPGSVYVGEIEGHTECGTAAARERGWANVHLFDAIRIGDHDLSSESYRARRDALFRAHSELATPEHFDGVWDNMRRSFRGVDGRYRSAPMDWRRFEIVPQLAPSQASDLWDMALADALEGLVVVDLDAPLGRRRSKLKCKPVDTIDCRVVAVHSKTATVQSFGCSFVVSRGKLELEPGSVVAVSYNGRYGDGTPRFARIDRSRTDLWHKKSSSSTSTTTSPSPSADALAPRA